MKISLVSLRFLYALHFSLLFECYREFVIKFHEKEKSETVAKEYKERKENKKRNVYHKKHSQVVS